MVSDGSRKGEVSDGAQMGRRKAQIHSILATYIRPRTIEVGKTIRTIREDQYQ
jgi:hypothetical protein